MGKPKAPEAPDPVATAQAQGEANLEAAIASALLNQQNVVGPEGTVQYQQTGQRTVGGQIVPTFTRTTTLTPEAQAQFEAQQQLGLGLTNLAQEQTGRIGGALGQGIDVGQLPALTGAGQGVDFQTQIGTEGLSPVREDFAQQGSELERATFERGLGLLDPAFARQREDVNRMVAERGLPISSEAAGRAFDPVLEAQSRAISDLALGSVGAGRGEQSRLFQQASQLRGQQFGEATTQQQATNQALAQTLQQQAQQAALENAARAQGFQEQAFTRSLPINDIAALIGTSPGVAAPQFQQTPAFGVQAPDVIGSTFGAANLANQQYQNQLGVRGGLLGGLFGLGGSLGGAAILSDRRAKAAVKDYGWYNGYRLYKYLKNGAWEIGVMAQDVLKTKPEAVTEIDGYLAVNYGAL